MAARLTDRQKKKIIADYIQLGSYSGAGKLNGVARQTVKRIVMENADVSKKIQKKKEENTADIIDYMDKQRKDVCEVLGICLDELKKEGRYEKISPQQIAKTMAISIDKYTGIGGAVQDEAQEDALSRSLREFTGELESDD